MTRLSSEEFEILIEALGGEVVRREKLNEQLSEKHTTVELDAVIALNKKKQDTCEVLLDKIGSNDIIIDDEED